MRNWNLKVIGVLLSIFLIGCATQQTPVAVSPSEQGKGVAIEAKSFEFRSNMIRIEAPGRLILHIKNVSSAEHNFTLKNPEGEIIKSVNLPEGQTVTTEIDLPRSGTYDFYCDKPFHSTFGMKGVVEVLGK